jgi:YHS domain-containing protein
MAAKAKCPVCDWEIKDAKHVKVGGKTLTVCCDECAAKVRENPSKYAKAK